MHKLISTTALAVLIAAVTSPVAAQEKNRMLLTGSGHGIIFDGKAWEQAGVPKEIADYIWGMQKQLTTYRSDLHKIPELGHKEVDTHAYLMKTLKCGTILRGSARAQASWSISLAPIRISGSL